MKTTWVLIANGSEARLFKAQKNYRDMHLLQEFYHPESREKAINLVTDAPGRYRKSVAPKSAFEEPLSPKKMETDKFAHTLANILEQGRTKNLYSNLIVIAPAHFQGLLNKCCSHFVINKIVDTLDKDYTKITEHELPNYLNGRFFGRLVA